MNNQTCSHCDGATMVYDEDLNRRVTCQCQILRACTCGDGELGHRPRALYTVVPLAYQIVCNGNGCNIETDPYESQSAAWVAWNLGQVHPRSMRVAS